MQLVTYQKMLNHKKKLHRHHDLKKKRVTGPEKLPPVIDPSIPPWEEQPIGQVLVDDREAKLKEWQERTSDRTQNADILKGTLMERALGKARD